MLAELAPGQTFPDLELPDHNDVTRRLSELAEGDPLVVNVFRGWWCPKEQQFFRGLVQLQAEAEVAYSPRLHQHRRPGRVVRVPRGPRRAMDILV